MRKKCAPSGKGTLPGNRRSAHRNTAQDDADAAPRSSRTPFSSNFPHRLETQLKDLADAT
jgi:hypothetical protein